MDIIYYFNEIITIPHILGVYLLKLTSYSNWSYNICKSCILPHKYINGEHWNWIDSYSSRQIRIVEWYFDMTTQNSVKRR